MCYVLGAREIGGVTGRQDGPGQRIGGERLEGFAGDHDRAAALGVDHDHDPRVRRGAHHHVGVDSARRDRQAVAYLPAAVVVADRGEEVNLRLALAELREGDPAAAARDEARLLQVGHVPRGGQRVHAPESDVLDVADHRDLHGTRVYADGRVLPSRHCPQNRGRSLRRAARS